MLHKDIDKLPPLREVIAAHDLQPTKALGQNFILDQNITDKIVRESGGLNGCTVFEIGPGPGGLTRSILKAGPKNVVAVEFDKRAVSALEDLKTCAGQTLEILNQDALKTDLLALSDGPRAIIANLPYNIATKLLINWLKDIRTHKNAYRFMSLMFQKEVGDRICAQPGSRTYGRLSVISQWLCDVRIIYDLPPSAFTPPPKVNSSVVHFIPKVLGDVAPSFDEVERITAQAFGQRRKMIRSSLKPYLHKINQSGIDPTKRAENLTVEDYLLLAS